MKSAHHDQFENWEGLNYCILSNSVHLSIKLISDKEYFDSVKPNEYPQNFLGTLFWTLTFKRNQQTKWEV